MSPGDRRVKVLMLRLEGKGCGSCIAPAKRYFLGLPMVRGVHILGYNVLVFLDEEADIDEVIERSGVKEYYWVRDVSVKHVFLDDFLGKLRKKSMTFQL